jgi:hypothetical protein
MVPADKLVALDLALAEKSARVGTTPVERAPSGVGSGEGDIDATRRYGEGARAGQIAEARYANEGVRLQLDRSALTCSSIAGRKDVAG